MNEGLLYLFCHSFCPSFWLKHFILFFLPHHEESGDDTRQVLRAHLVAVKFKKKGYSSFSKKVNDGSVELDTSASSTHNVKEINDHP